MQLSARKRTSNVPPWNVRRSGSFVLKGGGGDHRIACGPGARGTRRYTRTSRCVPFRAATGSSSVDHEVIAAHGTTTVPAAIVAPIRDVGIARYGGNRGSSLSSAW